MTLRTVALSDLVPAKRNPRRHIDRTAIFGLAESIKTDGLIQNLVVVKEGAKFRIVSGSRRYLALRLLRKRRVIGGTYKVPVEVRSLEEGDALRIATIENVQRADLEPMDEAEAFARMLQSGTTLDDLAAKTGLSAKTIRRRVALSDLCDQVKVAVRKNLLSLSIAEALTLGTHDQQRRLLKDMKAGAEFDREQIRDFLCEEKAPVSSALFSVEKYTGSVTRDLFGEKDTTYFDDFEQFYTLQNEAVEELALNLEKKFPWIDRFNSYSAPWWQYRDARKREKGGAVLNLKPNGQVEIKKNVVHHSVEKNVAAETEESADAPNKRKEFSATLIRLVGLIRSVSLQAALLGNTRKAKEIAVVSLLLGLVPGHGVRLDFHACVTGWDEVEGRSKALDTIRSALHRLTEAIGVTIDARGRMETAPDVDAASVLYRSVQGISDEDLEALLILLPLLTFGQQRLDTLEIEEGVFCEVANDVGLNIRDWWSPDSSFFALLRKEQLASIGAELGIQGAFKTKKKWVSTLAQLFGGAEADDGVGNAAAKCWLPEFMLSLRKGQCAEK